MVLIDREISVERFDYWRAQGDWALLELLTALPGTGDGPCPAHLVACVAGELMHASATEPALEHRLLGGHGPELLCRTRFTLPARAIDDPRTVFTLLMRDDTALVLPAPAVGSPVPRALILALPRTASVRRPLATPRRLAALATAIVVTGTAPAAALASGATQQETVGLSSLPPRKRLKRPVAKPKTPAAPTTTTAAAEAPTITTTTTTTTVAAPPTTTTAPTTTTTAPTTTTSPSTTRAPGTASTTTTTTLTTPGTSTSSNCQSATRHRGDASGARHADSQAELGLASTASSCTPTHRSGHGHNHQTSTSRHHRHRGSGSGRGTGTGTGTGTGHAGHHHRRHRHANGDAPASTTPEPSSTGTTTSPTGTSGGAGATGGTGGVSTLSPNAPGFLGPPSWTGTVAPDPTLTGVVRNLAGLLANGNRPPSFLIPIYMQAARRYHVPWTVLAAINAIESDYGRDLSTSTAGAVGWMQFEPSTWKEWGVAVDGHSVPNPYDPRDAIFSAARYLQAAGAEQSISKAVYAYNHAGWYVNEVLSRAHTIATSPQYERAALTRSGTFSVMFATSIRKHPRITYSGGVLSHYDRLIAAANMVSAANFPYVYGGGHEQPARFGPFDCSGSVSYVMQQAGYRVPTTVSGEIPVWKFPAGPGAVTIFYNPDHTFMRIGNRYFGTSGFARPGGGAGWFDVNRLPASYLATFREVHVPRLGVNSFAANAQLTWPQPQVRTHSRTFPLFLPRLHYRRAQR